MKILYTLFFAALITASCNQSGVEEKSTNTPEDEKLGVDYMAAGDSITNLAQGLLLKNVQGAMKKGGPVHAIDFCSVRAVPLMDSISKKENAIISRISVDFRNPMNKPNEEERKLLQEMQMNNVVDTLLAKSNTYYKSIKIFSPACLKCHGSVEQDIAPATLNKIREIYPTDYAVGYSLNDYRGTWKVKFDN